MNQRCSCNCGKSHVALSGEPVLRFKCHCLICQSVYKKPFADIVAVSTQQLVKPIDSAVEFAKHKLPPAVNRAVCPSCKAPVVALLPMLPTVGLAFIPAENFPDNAKLPEPAFHSFYHRRVADVNDSTLKISGYWASQWAVLKQFFFS